MSGLLTLASGSGSSSSSSAARHVVAAMVSSSTTSSSLPSASSSRPHRSFSTSSPHAHANSKQAQRKKEATLRSAIELYHLAPSFFPTPAQTTGFGAAVAEAAANASSSTSAKPQGDDEAHSVALDSAIRASIQTLITSEQQAAMDVIRAGSYQYSNSDSQTATLPAYKPVLAQRVVDLLGEGGEGSSSSDRRTAPLAGGTAATDGRGVGGPVYEPGRSAPISSLIGDPATISAASQRDFVRQGPDAERSLDAAFSPQSADARRLSPSQQQQQYNKRGGEDATSIRRELRFIKPRQPSARQGALRELYEVRNQYEAAVKALDVQTLKYMDPHTNYRGPAPLPPSSVPKPRFLENLSKKTDESGRSGAETRPRVMSAIAETDRLDARAARIRDALFGTVAAELPGLEVLRERRRLRLMRDKNLEQNS